MHIQEVPHAVTHYHQATLLLLTVNVLPSPSFISPLQWANVCVGTNVTYHTQSGAGINASSYVWSVPGTLGTDYSVTSGGTGGTNFFIILKWLTPGSKAVMVNYSSTAGCTSATPASNTTTAHALPTPSFTTQPGANSCTGSSVTYTTQAGASSYSWGIPGTSSVDYNITGGGTSTNSVTLNWISTGTKITTVNYVDAFGCTSGTPASNTTTVYDPPTPSFTVFPSATTCAGTSVTYTTQSGESGYAWSVPGTLGVDYSIVSGGITATEAIRN